jgi:hypothetical protein
LENKVKTIKIFPLIANCINWEKTCIFSLHFVHLSTNFANN